MIDATGIPAHRGSTYTRHAIATTACVDGFVATLCDASHDPPSMPTVTRACTGSMYSPVVYIIPNEPATGLTIVKEN